MRHAAGVTIALLVSLAMAVPAGAAPTASLVKDIRPGDPVFGPPGGADSTPLNITRFAGKVFFAATDASHGSELWKSNGTAAGTQLVKDICPGACGSAPGAPRSSFVAVPPESSDLTSVGGRLFFTAFDKNHGVALWKSDGTAAGTKLVKDVYPLANNERHLGDLTGVGNTLYFWADDFNNHGPALWKSDGTTAGTKLVKDPVMGTSGPAPSHLTDVNGTLFFTVGGQLWKSDGTGPGTTMVAATPSPSRLTDVDMGVGNHKLFFAAGGGPDLWTSDGTPGGTHVVSGSPAKPQNLTSFNHKVFFAGWDGTSWRIWGSDGTGPGTQPIQDLNGGGAAFTTVGAVLYFDGHSGAGPTLWKSDGTALGTQVVKTSPGPDFDYLSSANGLVFIQALGGYPSSQLWSSDGTPTGTQLVKDFGAQPSGLPKKSFQLRAPFAHVGGTLYFASGDYTVANPRGQELWKAVP
jgi:trimeric autotransporter adhesin